MSTTRGAVFKIYIEGCQTNIRQNSLIFRTAKHWNNLSNDTKNCSTVNAFKNAIDKELNTLRYDYDE